MFWIEESPTNAADDDSDVPFDECPGKPMACEQEIELIIKPDDDFDDHTWPETLSASGGASSTLVSSEENQSTVKDSDASANDEEDDVEEDAEQQGDCSDSGSAAVDDDATQIMGERHNNEGMIWCHELCFDAHNFVSFHPHNLFSLILSFLQYSKMNTLLEVLKIVPLSIWQPRYLLPKLPNHLPLSTLWQKMIKQ